MLIPLIHTAFKLYYFLVIASILLSWFPVNQYNEWFKMLHKITDPYLDFFRKIIPPFGMVDVSPIIALLVLGFIENILIRVLFMIGF